MQHEGNSGINSHCALAGLSNIDNVISGLLSNSASAQQEL